MSGLEVGRVVTATLPDAAQRLGLPGEVTGPIIRLDDEDGAMVVVLQIREPVRFALFVVRVPAHHVVDQVDPARARGTQETIRAAIRHEAQRAGAWPRLYTHADFDRETLVARGEALPFVPRTERQWAYALLMAQHVEWVEIDAPGDPAPVRITVRLDGDAPAEDRLAEIERLVEVYRPAGQVWAVSEFVPGVNR